jgi:hypothetical protein
MYSLRYALEMLIGPLPHAFQRHFVGYFFVHTDWLSTYIDDSCCCRLIKKKVIFCVFFCFYCFYCFYCFIVFIVLLFYCLFVCLLLWGTTDTLPEPSKTANSKYYKIDSKYSKMRASLLNCS